MTMINTSTLENKTIKAVVDRDEKSQLLSISKWLNILAITVVFMMFIGALTRLTGSGLSIPEWPLINGSLMYPSGEKEWTEVFEIYKQYPQYHIVNKNMSLDEFKVIFFYEYFHRSITTAVSLFLLIAMFKIFTVGTIRKKYKVHALSMFFLLIVQALAGMYMVNSGLEEGMASVSHYRLAIHLSLALIFLSLVVWTSVDIRYKISDKIRLNDIGQYFKSTLTLLGLVFIQFISGAFVSGTKAGFQFNDWPLMNGKIIPDNLFSASGRFSENTLLNFTENIVTIQFFHRIIAYSITGFIIWLIIKLKREKLSIVQNNIIKFLLIILSVQILLGISTLMLHVPIALAAVHQLGAVSLFLTILILLRSLKSEYGKKA